MCLLPLATSTEHFQEYTLLFQKKIRDLLDPVGTPPKSLYESHAWRALIKNKLIKHPFCQRPALKNRIANVGYRICF